MNKEYILNEFYSGGYDKPYNKNKLKNSDIVSMLIKLTDYLDKDVTYAERLYCLKNNITPNICECGEKTKFKSQKEGYAKFCSRKCMNSSDEIKDKRKNTTLKSQGGLGFASDKIMKKVKQTNIERYGVEVATQNKDVSNKISNTWKDVDKESILEKRKKTNLEKYGVEHHQQNIVQKEKIKDSLNSKHGGVGFASKTIGDKIKKTNILKYGTENAMSNIHIQTKMKDTIKQKFSVENISKHKPTIEKKKDNNILKYGYPSNSQSHLSEETIKILSDKKLFESGLKSSINAYDYSRKLGVTLNTVLFKIEKYGLDYISTSNNISVAETELLTYLQTLNNNIKTSDRELLGNGKEIDIYLPDYGIAIEMNGIYWHSERKGKYKNYHLEKTNILMSKGIQLIHVWDYEWYSKNSIIKSILKSKMGLFDTRLYARNCVIKEIDQKTKATFLENNHLQGNDKSSENIGLFYNDELVSVMTFGNSRFNRNYEKEMHRFCNKQGYQIVGGASKLWKYYNRKYKPNSVITYADKRFSDGLFYIKIGFKEKNISQPNFWVFGKSIDGLSHRIAWQKHKLEKKLNIFKKELTAWENMLLNGYDRVWDCGNYVFEFVKD